MKQLLFRASVLELVIGCGLLLSPLAGCNSADATAEGEAHGHDHDHSSRPASLHAAVAELKEMREAIRLAIVEGNPDDAHDPLHEIGGLLEALPDVAAETDLPKEEWEAVKTANDRLFASFGEIDKAFHKKDGDKKAAYELVAADLDEAIAAISSRLSLTGEDPVSVDHDHGHDHAGDDHDEHDGHAHDHDEDHATTADASEQP